MRILLGMVALIAAMMITPTAHAEDATPAQESLLRPGCTGFYTTDTGHKDPSQLDKWVDTRTKIYARQCFGPSTGNRWVDPVNVEFSYNVEHGEESCGFFDPFEGVRYDLYMQDGAGRNYHLPTVVLDCEDDTTGWTIESLRLSPNFTVCGTAPRWHTHYTIKIDNANDVSGTHRGTLWAFVGPVKDQC